MRCLFILALCLLALGVALALEPASNSEQFMCPEASSDQNMPCTKACLSNQDCSGNAVCCPSAACGGRACKTPANFDIPKAGNCPWGLQNVISAEPCPEKDQCTKDSDCDGNKKCCTVKCAKTCENPVAAPSLQ